MSIRSGLMSMGLLVAGLGICGCTQEPMGDQTDSRVMRNSDSAGSLVNPNNRPDLDRAYYGTRTPPGQVGNGASAGTNTGTGLTGAPVNDNVNITGTGGTIGGGNGSYSPAGTGNSSGNRGSEIGRGIGGTGGTGGAGSASAGAGGR